MLPVEALFLLFVSGVSNKGISKDSTAPCACPVCGGAAAAAAKSLQSCPTLCDPINGSPRGSPVPGILQALLNSF